MSHEKLEFHFGQNIVNDMLQKAYDLEFDELICVSYNVNLDYAFRLIDKYGFKLVIYANTEKITLNKNNFSTLERYVSKGVIELNHISENLSVIHSKFYLFRNRKEPILLAIGSPNFSQNSNQNYESLCYITNKDSIEQFWAAFTSSEVTSIPPLTNDIPPSFTAINVIPENQQKYLDSLWIHQQNILTWLFRKGTGIVNIPPGTGKTRISIQYLKMLFETKSTYSGIILVPTLTLIEQWAKLVSEIGLDHYELTNNISELSEYISNPNNKVLITLYSRFFDHQDGLYKQLRISSPDLILVYDECHNLYGKLAAVTSFRNNMKKYSNVLELGLSATLDSFKVDEMNEFIDYMGGISSRYEISLPAFYSNYNNLNKTPILKNIKYIPLKYYLTNEEMKKFDSFSRKVAMQMGRVDIENNNHFGAAIQRAQWLRSLNGGSQILQDYIQANIENFTTKSTIIFVQSHQIAEEIQQFLVQSPGWERTSSVYIYDSYQNDVYRDHALKQFKKNTGFCLISERMLSEGFDLPKVDKILLHGSHRSERDWIQKIGRAIRYNSQDSEAVADIIDVVFCEPSGLPLDIEKERYRTLESISV